MFVNKSLEHESQMKSRRKWMHRSLRTCFILFQLTAVTAVARPQATPDFSGLWEQDNDRCQPKRTGDVTLHIEHHGAELVVETHRLHMPRRAPGAHCRNTRSMEKSRYQQERTETNSTPGLSVEAQAWSSLSDGHILHSQETWSLIEKSATLERIRERPNGEKQILFYRRRQSLAG